MNNQVKKIKSYTYFFKDGGWNTASGINRRDAYKNARNRWLKEDPKLVHQVDKDSFHIASKEEEEKLLSNFW